MTPLTENYRHANGTGATLTYTPTPRGFVVALEGWNPFRVRFLNLDTAQMTCGLMRLRLRMNGFERVDAKQVA